MICDPWRHVTRSDKRPRRPTSQERRGASPRSVSGGLGFAFGKHRLPTGNAGLIQIKQPGNILDAEAISQQKQGVGHARLHNLRLFGVQGLEKGFTVRIRKGRRASDQGRNPEPLHRTRSAAHAARRIGLFRQTGTPACRAVGRQSATAQKAFQPSCVTRLLGLTGSSSRHRRPASGPRRSSRSRTPGTSLHWRYRRAPPCAPPARA